MPRRDPAREPARPGARSRARPGSAASDGQSGDPIAPEPQRLLDLPAHQEDAPSGADATPDLVDPDAPPPPDPAAAARDALARARKAVRDKGFRPGMKPACRPRPLPGQPARSGARPDDRDPALLGDQLTRLLDERGWQADVQVGSVLGRWPLIVGPEVSTHVVPISFDGSTLRVQADSTAWATQMRLLTSVILGRIEQEAGPGVVTELVVEGPAAPSWVKGRRRVAGRGPRDTYG